MSDEYLRLWVNFVFTVGISREVVAIFIYQFIYDKLTVVDNFLALAFFTLS